MRRGMLACKGGDLAAVSAGRHGTPAAAMRAGLVVEEEPALGIGANSERRLWTLGDKFRRRTGNGSQQPIQAAFARDRKSTRLNSSHSQISYAVFCLKKKTFRRWRRPAGRSARPATRD